jgi:hypothetical protein
MLSSPKRKRDTTAIDLSTPPQSEVAPSKVQKVEHAPLTLLPIKLKARPRTRSKDWPEYNHFNCDDRVILQRIIKCAQVAFPNPDICKLELVDASIQGRADCKEPDVKIIDITLNNGVGRGWRFIRLAIKIVESFRLPKYVETMESHSFLLVPRPSRSGSRAAQRQKFETMILSQTNSALISFLEDGRLFPLSQLGQLLQQLVVLTADPSQDDRLAHARKSWAPPVDDLAHLVPGDVGLAGWGAVGATTSCNDTPLACSAADDLVVEAEFAEVAAKVKGMGGRIARTSVPAHYAYKKAAFALSLAKGNGEGAMYYCGHGRMSSTTTIKEECDKSCVAGKKYSKKDVQLCHKWACSNQIKTGNWGVFRTNHEVVVCCIDCHLKIDRDLGRSVD